MRCSSWCGFDITPDFFSTRVTHDGKNGPMVISTRFRPGTPRPTSSLWLFQLDDSKPLHGKWLFHQTSIKNWLFRVPGNHGEVENTENSHVFFDQKTPRESLICGIFFHKSVCSKRFSTWFHGTFFFK